MKEEVKMKEDKILARKEELKKLLKVTVLDITFTKTDGTERTMRSTLKEEFIPKEVNEAFKLKATTPPNPLDERNVLAVWDMEKNTWRSFRVSSIINVKDVGHEIA